MRISAMDNGSTESTRDILDRRERELMDKASKLRDQLAPIEKDLADIRRAKAALGMNVAHSPPTDLMVNFATKKFDAKALAGQTLAGQTLAGGYDPFERLTIKGLVIKALDEHFREGATTQQLSDFFRDAWGRNIERASLSPQLSRLQGDGAITRVGELWRILPRGVSEEELKAWGVIPPWAVLPDRFKQG
jgi:hypothetical protein